MGDQVVVRDVCATPVAQWGREAIARISRKNRLACPTIETTL
jgi:hypothetical protein